MAHHDPTRSPARISAPALSPPPPAADHEAGRPPPAESGLPPLLQLISDADYACIHSSPSPPHFNHIHADAAAHSAINISELERIHHSASTASHEDLYGSTGITTSSEPSLPAVSIPAASDDAVLTSDIGTNIADMPSNKPAADAPISPSPKPGALRALKSTIWKRGVSPRTADPRGGVSPASPGSTAAELAKKVSFASKPQLEDRNNTSTRPPMGASMHGSPYQAAQANPTKQAPNDKAAKRKCYSQPMPTTAPVRARKGFSQSGPVRRCTTVDPVRAARDNELDNAKTANYALFRTKSAKTDKPLARKQSSKKGEDDPSTGGSSTSSSTSANDEAKSVPAGRYFDALRGPELEFVKDSEDLLLPQNQTWPFLLRFPIGCFGICLGLGSQAVLYKTLATSPSTSFLKIPLAVNFALWCLAFTALVVVFITYGLKCVLYFEAVRREYYHPVRVNFFFAPWIACMFLTMGIPPRIVKSIHPAVWCIFTAPLLMLKLKIYGQWLSGGQRRLSKVANPSTHLSLVGNFVSAMLAAVVGWKEPAMFFWAVGCAHYLVVFVTLYQRLPTAEVLPKELHPVFFLFVAAPSVASVAWKNIVGQFDRVSKTAYFLALFLYSSLVVRMNFFCGFQFSVTWWAYTFPMTASAIATINYAVEVRHPITQGLAVILSGISSVVVMSVFVSTIYHALMGNLFPNDVAIAITRRRHRRKQKGSKVEPLEQMSKQDEEDSTKLFLASGGSTIVASLENGLISFTSDPFPVRSTLESQHSGFALS